MNYLVSKGISNNAAVYMSDEHNISNTNNQVVFNKIMSGSTESPMLNYLLNYQVMRLNDVRSVLEYNYGNISLMIAENLKMEEIVDEYTVLLPTCKSRQLGNVSLYQALKKRRTIREFIDQKVSIKNLSELLQFGVGVKHESENLNGFDVPLRYYGSGGGLYPIRTYLYVQNVKGIQPDLYKYQPFSHSLRSAESEDISLHEIFSAQKAVNIENVSFAIFFVYEMNKNYMKYGELALAQAFIEVGLMSQNLHLLSQCMGIGTCDMGGFNKVLLEKKMHLCGINRHVVYSILFGKAGKNVEI